MCFVSSHNGLVWRSRKRLAFDLVVGPLFTVADVNKIEHGLSLCKAQCKVPKVIFVVYASITTHGFAEASQVRIYCRNNLNVVCMLAALMKNGGPEGIGCLFTAFYTSSDIAFLELDGNIRSARSASKRQ